MNSDQFVSALVKHVHTAAIEDTVSQLDRPSGRRPPKKVARAALWYASLSEQDKESLKSVIELSVHGALFGMLCAIDGVRTIQEDPDHEFELNSVSRGTGTRLNTPEGEFLHDQYQALVYSQVFE
jgi:hypothetical protein